MMQRTTRRPLKLHVSALSNEEYNAYTRSIAELTSPLPDEDWENITMSVREARGWIRGRYGVDGAIIDQILRYFAPDLGAHDMLSGGQFFAALRLVSHAQAGATVDESLVFVQANPDRGSGPRSPSPRPLSRTPSMKSAPPPPPRPTTSPETPSLPPRTAPPVPPPNPFTRTNSHPASSRPRTRPESQPPPPSDPPVSSNPFLRTQSSPRAAPSASSASSADSTSPSNPKQYVYPSPPLPPRKPSTSLLPPPRHASLASSKVSMTPSSATLPTFAPPVPAVPIKPPRPPQATSPLIKQSLQAAKGAQSAKEALDGLNKERRLEVIKKSGMNGSGELYVHTNGSSSGSGSASASGSRDGGTPMPIAPRPPSPPESFYDVAAARIGSSPISVSSAASSVDHNAAPNSDTPGRPQFAHTVIPDTPPSPASSAGNPRRSKSLHHPSPSSSSPSQTPPAPPPRRKRPESVQVTSAGGSPFANASGSPSLNGSHARSTSGSAPTSSPSPLSRHLSFSHASEPGPPSGTGTGSVIDTLHRTFANLNLRPGPGFESARIKAEGRVWPGGYVKGLAGARGSGFERREDGRRLVSGEEDGGFGQDEDGDTHQREGGSRTGVGGKGELERDELKMPVRPGEGWSPLG